MVKPFGASEWLIIGKGAFIALADFDGVDLTELNNMITIEIKGKTMDFKVCTNTEIQINLSSTNW